MPKPDFYLVGAHVLPPVMLAFNADSAAFALGAYLLLMMFSLLSSMADVESPLRKAAATRRRDRNDQT